MVHSLSKLLQSERSYCIPTLFSMGFGSAAFHQGIASSELPRLETVEPTHLMALGLSVTVPDQPSATIARIYLGSCLMCTVTEHRGEWQYLISGHLVINGDQTLLQAQLSALVHEAIAAKANHNPSDYAGIIPTGV